MNRRKKSLIFIWSLLSLTGLLIINLWFRNITQSDDEQFNKAVNSYKQKEFSGVIVDKFIDKYEHKNKKVIIDTDNIKRTILFNIETSGIYDFFEVGDSIIKDKGTMQVRVIRHDLDTILEMKLLGLPDQSSNN